MRQILQAIKISIKNLLTAKMRSFLTILGIIIGVGSVIVIMAIGASAQFLIIDQIAGIGSNLVAVLPGASGENEPPAAAMGITVTTLTYDDLRALTNSRNVPEVESGAGYVIGTTEVVYQSKNNNYSFTGTTSDYVDVENSAVSEGRFFSKEEDTNLSRIAVLGSNVAEELFEGENPLNKKIEISGQKYAVVGILEKRDSAGFGVASQNDTIYIPLLTAQKLIMGINHLGFIRLKVASQDLIVSAVANAKATLREQHNITDPVNDDFSVRDQVSAIKAITQVTTVLRYFVLAIGSISLLVGGIGIMNTMLITVKQRIREVGLRKAVGAKNEDILGQFLVESATITLIGGIIGIILGIGFASLISAGARLAGYNWPFLVSLGSVAVAVGVSILIGVIFGMYPARKASRISPMEALRYE